MGTAIPFDEIKRFEITEVYSHPDAKVDIVLVHGLNGDPKNTWTSKKGTFWPTQLLPVSLKSSQARILVYGYNADVYAFGTKSASSDMIFQHAQSLVNNFALERKSEEMTENPIIWVAHSLGGILVKRALELSNDLTNRSADDSRNIFVSTYGIIFLGTPHNGADPAKWGIILQSMVNALVPRKFMETESQMVKTLQSNNETLQDINLRFLEIYQKFKVCMVHEAAKTDLKGTKMLIVDQNSAGPLLPDVQYFGIEATHSEMCKFESKNSPGYLNISTTIKSWVEESPRVIKARQDMERRLRQQDKEAKAREMLGIFEAIHPTTPSPYRSHEHTHGINTPDLSKSGISFHSIASIEPDLESMVENEPYFIKPASFRPNSLFVGRETELGELHKLLFDKKRRNDGTSAVLVQSMPGGGKTHLARQYVYDHKDDFPGGIFWIRAKAMPELAAGYWDIARKAALRGSTEDLSKDDSEQFIRLVKKWLNQRQDWLLVLDGVHFDDPEALQKYIPDSPNTSLIYTSTEKAVSNDYQFMNPQVIRLPLLSAREAQTLLLLELDNKDPTKDDLLHSMELVQAMGFLPVVIHAVAQRLKATNEPLAKFARHYAAEPKLRGLGAYIAVVEQLKMLGAIEALNLLRILCFFSQHIPVEMIVLGLKALDVPVKASEPISGRTLNNTFKILNSFALIARNEPAPSLHSSQSSKGSRDMIANHVDVVRLHSVVESFFIDTLLAEDCLPLWLDRAVRLFCCSYDAANDRIARKTSYGLVEDFRLYEIHGNRLREHVRRHLKRSEVLEEALSMLDSRLDIVKGEIERRTPESSHVIVDGGPDAFQISIFDRASSSSDADPETPGTADRHNNGKSPWGMELDQSQLESPVSIKSAPYDEEHEQVSPYTRQQFPPLRARDDGYDTDMDESMTMTAKTSQRTIKQNENPNRGEGAWEIVTSRRPKLKPATFGLHRTIRTLEKQRYSDTAGAFRAVSASLIDPRVTRETAQGFLQRNNSRARTRSRGRISGQSQAEVALTHITQSSPPPKRGGGKIQDRRSDSRRQSQERRLVAGAVSYAAAVASPTRDNVPGFREPRPVSDSLHDPSATLNSASPPLPSVAMASLKRMSHDLSRLPPSSTLPSSSKQPLVSMPPYPHSPSPYLANMQQNPLSDTATYVITGKSPYSQENLTLGSDPYPHKENIYPPMTGPLPYETLSSSWRERNLSYDHRQRDSRSYELGAASFPAPTYTSPGDRAGFSPFSINLTTPILDPYARTAYSGYTSQPMSRDPSGQSATAFPAQRRASLASTEPLPQLPRFSPRPGSTNYQDHDGVQPQEYVSYKNTPSVQGQSRKSPRLDFARAALVSRLEELPEDLYPSSAYTQRPFNPRAPSFSPRASRVLYNSLSETSTPYPTAEMHQTEGGDGMSRSGSGGLRVGNRVIEFGDFPDPIDLSLARERVRESWAAREDDSFHGALGLDIRK